jgi:hypothetical protein
MSDVKAGTNGNAGTDLKPEEDKVESLEDRRKDSDPVAVAPG